MTTRALILLVLHVAILPVALGVANIPGPKPLPATAKPWVSQAWCSAHGDIHYQTFDGAHFDYQGFCKHLLVGVCCRNTRLPYFNVYVKGEIRNGNSAVSWLHYVEIEYAGHFVRFTRQPGGGSAIVTGDDNIPGTSLVPFGDGYEFTTVAPVLKVIYDGVNSVTVFLDSAYANQTCGMCGNYNYVGQDDYTTRPGVFVGQSNGDDIGDSWVVSDHEDPTQVCLCRTARKQCSPDAAWRTECDRVIQQFARCMDAVFLRNVYTDCQFDACHSNGVSIRHTLSYLRTVAGIRSLRC